MSEEKDVEMHDSSGSRSHFQIFVRIVTGSQYRTFTIRTAENERIENIAKQLSVKTGVESQHIILSYCSKILSLHRTINHYNISRESTLNASIRCRLNYGLKGHHDQCFGAFPFSVSNKSLMDKIQSIDDSINHLINRYQNKLTNTNSINHLNKMWNEEIKNMFNIQYKTMQNKKLEIYEQINSNNNRQKSSIQFELDSAQNNMHQIDQNIKNLDNKIKEYQQMIKQCEDKKTESLKRKINQKNEFHERLKSLEGIKNEWNETNKEIISIQTELSSSSNATLSDCFDSVLRGYENKYDEWSNNDVIEWIKSIENGIFNDDKYREILVKISKLGIDGNKLENLRNETCLELIGLNLMERRVLLKNIDRVLNKGNNDENSNICTVCTVQRINSVFLPCGHQSCCYQCYEKRKRRFTKCPICRKEIKNTVKTFMNGFK